MKKKNVREKKQLKGYHGKSTMPSRTDAVAMQSSKQAEKLFVAEKMAGKDKSAVVTSSNASLTFT